ncbi:MAG: ArsR family transcriptional regulator [Candidatus Nanoarchaeia archaeon]|nr:ArsR family transcriptional regulator [Candidatus Nanoarchaeia archaeon]
MRITKVTIIRKTSPLNQNINDLLLRFGESLGLFSSRDKDKSCYRIFIVLLKALKLNIELTSDELADKTKLTRGTIIHHLNHLIEAGIVTSERGKYFLNVRNLEDLVSQMRDNVNAVFDDIQVLAQKIDDVLELN